MSDQPSSDYAGLEPMKRKAEIRIKLGAKRYRKRLKEQKAERENEDERIRRRAISLGSPLIDWSKLYSRSVMGSFGVKTLGGRYYLDFKFCCQDCGKREVWKGSQQKWWFEEAGGEMEQIAIRCRACRTIARQKKAEARRIHLGGLEQKQNREQS